VGKNGAWRVDVTTDIHPGERADIGQSVAECPPRRQLGFHRTRDHDVAKQPGKKLKLADLMQILERRGIRDVLSAFMTPERLDVLVQFLWLHAKRIDAEVGQPGQEYWLRDPGQLGSGADDSSPNS